jgi:protein involved in polysaccharide export with SLBB domain
MRVDKRKAAKVNSQATANAVNNVSMTASYRQAPQHRPARIIAVSLARSRSHAMTVKHFRSPLNTSLSGLFVAVSLGSLAPVAQAQTTNLNSALGLPTVNNNTGAYGSYNSGTQGSATGAQQGAANGYGTSAGTYGTNGSNTGQQTQDPLQNLQTMNRNGLRSGLMQPGAGIQNGVLNVNAQAPGLYVPGAFEAYVQTISFPQMVRRLGADLMQPDPSLTETSPVVPADYVLLPGDEVAITAWGSVDIDTHLQVDRSGRIALPRVGSIVVAGTRYADLPGLISKQVAKVFRGVNLSVTLGQLRGIRVYLTGYVARPGSYSVRGLSTVSSLLIQSGGPTAAGSFRQIEVRRQGGKVATFDLYDLLVTGNRGSDMVLQPDDVIHVTAVGTQVAMLGSVNQPAIVELKSGETLGDALRMVGGASSVADLSRVAIEPLGDRGGSRVVEVSLPAGASRALQRGDVVNIYSAVDVRQPTVRQNKRVVVEGEVMRPGAYIVPASTSINDVLAQAGGLTPHAYVFGTQFTRETVRQTQAQSYERVLRDLELDITRASTTQRISNSDEVKAQEARSDAASRLVEKMRNVQPDGRVVLQIPPDATALPNLQIEDGDRISIPALPTSVGVFGSVFNTGNFVYGNYRHIGDYLQQAGGPTRGADKDSVFVVRANGSVVSNLQNSGWFSSGSLSSLQALPGDTIFVPEEMSKTTGVQNAKDWTQILYQLGLGLAGLRSATN